MKILFGTINATRESVTILIDGDTFNLRETLKASGYKWNDNARGWEKTIEAEASGDVMAKKVFQIFSEIKKQIPEIEFYKGSWNKAMNEMYK